MLNHQSIDPYNCRGCDFMKNAYECALCSFLCDSETDFRTHLNAEHKSNFLPCVYCETLYNASHFLLRHLKATHCLESKVYRCGSVECTFKTTVLRKFSSHLDMCTGGKAVRCYHCKSTFSSSNLLLLHIQGKLKILLNKAYPVDKIIRIVPSPASPPPVPVFQTHLNIREPKSGIPSNLNKIVQKSDISPVDTLPTVPVPSSSSKRPYILPKLIVAKPVEQTVQTYSAVATPQEVSGTRKILHDENSPHIIKGAVILPLSPNTGNSNTFINSGNLPKNSLLDVCPSGKLPNISFCQIPPGGVTALKMSEVSNKTAVVNANVSPLPVVKVENDLLKRGISDNVRRGSKLVTVPLVRLDITKNVAIKNTIPSNQTHCAGFPNSSGIVMSATELPGSADVNSSTFSSFQQSAFNKNAYNAAYQKHCVKIPSKIMLISVPPPSPVLQSGVSKTHIFKDVSSPGGTPIAELCNTSTNMNILSSAKQNTVKFVQSLCTKSVSQESSQSSLFTPSSTVCELDTVSKAVPEPCAKFSQESKVTEQARFSSLDQSIDRENILSFAPGAFVSKFSTACSERNCDTSELFQSAAGSQTPFFLPVSSVTEEELMLSTDTSKTSSTPTSTTFVTYVKQEVISSCDAQFETAVPGLPLKSEVASNEKICDRFNDYYGDIAAVVSNHSLLSQQDNNASVSAASGNLISGAQNFHLTSESQNGTSVSTRSSSEEFLAIKEEPPSPPFSCIDMNEISVSTSSSLISSVKEEIISDCDLQLRTPPLSPIVTKTTTPSDSLFSNSFSVFSLGHNDTETVSSAVSKALPSPDERNSDPEVIKPACFSEVYSSHNSVFKTSSPAIISNLYKENRTASVCHNANGSQFTCSFTLPVSDQCTKSVTAVSANPLSASSQVLLDANSSVYAYTNGFKSVTSPSLSVPLGLVNKNGICDVTFTTLAIKPEMSSDSSLSQIMLNTKGNHENSSCELASCAPVTCHSETLVGNVSSTFSAQHSAKMFSNCVPVNLIIPTSAVGGMGNEGGIGTIVNTSINEDTSTAVRLLQISTASSISICDSEHTSMKHSTVTSFQTIIPKDQYVSAASNDHQSSHACITTLENDIPHPNLHNVSCTKLSETQVLQETAENLVARHRMESMISCDESDVPCASSSCSPDDRHPFLNSTNMTVRQILDKFRGKYKSNVNTSRKDSLRTTSQIRKNVRDLRKQHILSSNPLSSPASTSGAPSANETILKPSVVEVCASLPTTQHTDGEDVSVVSYKRKASQVQEVGIMKNPTPKVQKFEEHLIFSHDQIEIQPSVHYTGECSIKSEIEPSYENEQSIFDQYCFSELENEAISDSQSTEDMCSATDILQVAKELLSYNETPEEMTGEPTDIFQALKRRKSEKVLKEMLRPFKLKDFFKCMARHCSYTSNICIEFSEHLKGHDTPLCTCAYCLVDFPARDNLICHLMQEHKKSLFQCSLCFYRAFSQTQVCIHFRKFHSCEKGHIISCSPVDAHPLSTFKENYMAYYANIVKPYSCCFCACSFSCTAILDVIHHILYCHSDRSYVCKECDEQHSDIFEWLIHCQLHGIHLFHCIHCAFGAEMRNDMLHHISMYHPNESLVVFVRSSRYLMLHLEHILKYRKKANLKNLCDISSYSPVLVKEELEIEIQVILENTISMDRTLKCLYCLCSTEYASEIQTHLYSKHSENDILRYCFSQSQFQTISEAEFIFDNLLSSYSSNKVSTACTDMILADRNNITLNRPRVPLRIVFVETPNGVVNLHLPLAVFKESNLSRKYTRIFQSLYNQIQSKIRRKRFKCLYCQKTERYLYKLRQHWRYCHVQTGKKFQYELIHSKKYRVAGSSHETGICGNTDSKEDFNSSPASHFQKCSACVCSHKTSETMNGNWDSINVPSWLHSQCGNSRNNGFKIDSLPPQQNLDNGGYCSGNSRCCNSSNFLQKVPSEECSCYKCNCRCKVCPHTSCRIKCCYAEITGNQIYTYDVENKVQHLRSQCSDMFKNYKLLASCYCLMKCSKKTRCFKKRRSGETDRQTNNVKLKVFLRKLPYSVKLPVLYLQQIIHLNPVVVLSDIKYQHKMK